MSTMPLPAKASLSQLRARAKELRKAVAKGRPDAIERARAHHPSYDEAGFTLRDAQLTIAREYGLASWQELMEKVATELVEGRELHRYFGVELNNETWDLLEQIDENSPLLDQERLLYGAYAACLHWLEAGNEANHARGEHLIARVALRIGRTEIGLRHARRCLELVQAFPEQMADWDEPFAREALARALAAIGSRDQALAELRRAEELTKQVAQDGDREVLLTELAKEPWFGLTS
ncbi:MULTISPECIES: hypothetical protein [Kribbella]|uniref:Tetratricopeptide repeat protein n=1 Tax=Kribbella pratensis TaxID=2512112 RepID=A0ABY2F8Y3_9ACTN|nr:MULTISPECIES: hypothetical protein [Kribbella]TDW86805.1 hypothetical protein EV137_4874 [Kribbella pratensis]TDW91872.1 hypothetical protein EV647_5455 [Kribbella sp. VKM Ac-2566]